MSSTPHKRKPWCIVIGDPNPFPVPVPEDDSDLSISELQTMIKEKSPLLESVYATSLTLWKVRYF